LLLGCVVLAMMRLWGLHLQIMELFVTPDQFISASDSRHPIPEKKMMGSRLHPFTPNVKNEAARDARPCG